MSIWSFLLTWLVATVSLVITAYVVPGVTISSLQAAAVAAIIMGLVNAVVRPIITILTLPLTVFTLGLFLLVINAICLSLVGYFAPGVQINGFWPAIFGAIVLSVVSSIIGSFVNIGEQ